MRCALLWKQPSVILAIAHDLLKIRPAQFSTIQILSFHEPSSQILCCFESTGVVTDMDVGAGILDPTIRNVVVVCL